MSKCNKDRKITFQTRAMLSEMTKVSQRSKNKKRREMEKYASDVTYTEKKRLYAHSLYHRNVEEKQKNRNMKARYENRAKLRQRQKSI